MPSSDKQEYRLTVKAAYTDLYLYFCYVVTSRACRNYYSCKGGSQARCIKSDEFEPGGGGGKIMVWSNKHRNFTQEIKGELNFLTTT